MLKLLLGSRNLSNPAAVNDLPDSLPGLKLLPPAAKQLPIDHLLVLPSAARMSCNRLLSRRAEMCCCCHAAAAARSDAAAAAWRLAAGRAPPSSGLHSWLRSWACCV
jgi:hypothetical protein